jgi:hypothetical protein
MNLYKITTNIGEKFVVEKDIQSACALFTNDTTNDTIDKIELIANNHNLKLPTEKYDLTEVFECIKNHCGAFPNAYYSLGTSRILYLPIQDVNEVIKMITGVDLNLTEKFK